MKKLLIFLFALAIGVASFGQEQYNNKWYGIKYDPTDAASAVTRIYEDTCASIHSKNMLPIQRLMKGCLLYDNGVVNSYLNATDWTSGSPDLTGSAGQVMVEIPAHYELFETVAGWNYAKFCLTYKAGYKYMPKMYVGAFKATVTSSKMRSIGNGTTYPTTSFSRTNGRIYAQNRGANWSMISYQAWKTLYWLYVIEYANRNCQLAYDPTYTALGYAQGGLGAGVTELASWDGSPSIKCGVSNTIGNFSGAYTLTGTIRGTSTTSTGVPRYRGIESPFGDIWEWMDGISIYHSVSPRASYAYIIDNPNYFSDNNVNLGKARAVMSLSLSPGRVTTIVFGPHGDLLPSAIGGGSTTYWCDYFYTPQNVGTAGWYAPFVGGDAIVGADAGFGYVYSDSGASVTYTEVGSRLCFLGS